MGKISYKDYVIEFSNVSLNYCLYRKISYQKIGSGTKEKPNGEFAERLDALAYDMPIEYLIKKIISLETETGTQDVESLESFLKMYNEVWAEIRDFFKSTKTV